jgi:ubiquinone/menaquinone biosynthesis C-methylase UbiE
MFGENALKNASSEIDKLISLVDIESKTNVLDLGCGIGRHSLELARRGFLVTGVDRTKSYLENAEKIAKEEDLTIEFILGDMRTFTRLDTYQLAISMFTTFSYFEDPEEDKKTLRNIYTSLKKGGKFVLEMMGKEVLARIFLEKEWQENNDVFFLQERKVSKDWSWMQGRWILFKEGKKYEYNVDHRLYSGMELTELLKNVGFSKIKIYGGLEGSPYDNHANRIVAVAEK